MPLPELDYCSWSATLTHDNIESITDKLDSILRHRCTVVTVIRDIDTVYVHTSQDAEIQPGGHVAVAHLGTTPPFISWSTASYYWTIHPGDDNPVRLSWHDGTLSIRHNAPAGHPLLWIFAPERKQEGK